MEEGVSLDFRQIRVGGFEAGQCAEVADDWGDGL